VTPAELGHLQHTANSAPGVRNPTGLRFGEEKSYEHSTCGAEIDQTVNSRRHVGFWWGFLLVPVALSAAGAVLCPGDEMGRVVDTAEGLQISDAAAGLRAGDVLVQLNSHLLRGCDDLADALAEARSQHLTRLFLVRREHGLAAVALPPTAAATVAAAAPVIPPAAPTPLQVVAATPAPVVAPTPLQGTLAPSDAPAVRASLNELQQFGRALHAALPALKAQPWARRVRDLRRALDGRRAEAPAVQALTPLLDYYQTAADILGYKEQTVVERSTHELGQKPPQTDAVFEYHNGTQVSTWLERYPFLQDSVVDAPRVSFIGGERNGTWVPDRAIALLVDHALADGDAIGRRLDSR
jgi:hypothetical protein